VSCELTQVKLHAYFDGELDAPSAAAFESHLKSCGECQSALDSEKALRDCFTRANLYEHAPAGLRKSLSSQLSVDPAPAAVAITPAVSPAWRWLALAASFLFVASLGWQIVPRFRTGERGSTVVAAALDAHLRSLQQGHLADVLSTDQHTVKPWFDGRIDFAPPVRDFAADGYPLLGGRLDVLDGKTVAALVYGRRKHVINVFVWPVSPSAPASSSSASQGYNWVAWQNGGFAFCAVSDVNSNDLQELRQLFARP
jgi:anti-sigma factor (TIGR02949 family)